MAPFDLSRKYSARQHAAAAASTRLQSGSTAYGEQRRPVEGRGLAIQAMLRPAASVPSCFSGSLNIGDVFN